MFILLATVVVALVIIGIGAAILLASDTITPLRAVAATLVGFVGVLVFLAAFGWHEIGIGTVGVITSFGKIQGQVQPGLVWLPPIANDVAIMDTKTTPYNFGGDPNANPAGPGIEAFTKENQTATMYGVVTYHLDPTYAADVLQTVGQDYFEKVIHHQTDTEIKRDSRNYTTDEITAKRDELAAAAFQRLQADVAPYHIVIEGIFISQIGLPKEYLDSVNQKLIAQQGVITAQAQADITRTNAAGQADAAVTIAEGQAKANEAVNSSLSDALIRWQSIQKLNPNVNVMVVPQDGNFLFNLPTPSSSPAP